MKHFNLSKLKKAVLAGLTCSVFLFGSVAQTVFAENGFANFENRKQISFASVNTNASQRGARNKNRNDKLSGLQERRNEAKPVKPQASNNKTEINNDNSNNYNISAAGDVVIGTMHKDSHNDNSVNINNSKNDNRVYDSSINNSEIDNSTNKGATVNSHNTTNSHNTKNSNNISVTKNGSGQTRANGAGAVNVRKNDNASGARGVNVVKTQSNSTNQNTVSNQNVVVKKNTVAQQNLSVKKNRTNGTSSNVQSNAAKNNTMPVQQNNNHKPAQLKNNTGARNGGNVNNANNAQRMSQNNQTTINNKNSNNYNIGSDGDVVIGEMYKDSHDNNSKNIDNSVNDNRVYDKSINNSKIDSSVNKGATINSHNTENSHNVTDSGNVKVEINENINHDPQGKLDKVELKSLNQLYVKGWAYDEDDMNSSVTVEFHVGSETGVLLSKATANKFYTNEIKNHGFEETYTVNLVNNYYGWQTVYAIAKNIGNTGKDQKIGEGRINIVIPSPNGSATISDPDTSRRIKITGWTNTERVEYIVAGTTRTININNPSYTTKNFEEYYTLPQEMNGQIQVQVYAVDTTNHYAKKSIGNRSIVIKKPIPEPDGSANITYEQKDRKVKISGWSNTERVEYVVAGTTRAISINNPNHIRQNFADTYVLPNGIKGIQTADVYAIDTTNTYTKKKIGANSFNATPNLNGSIQSITSPTTKTVRVIGKTNAPRIIIAVGNIARQEFDLANPNYEEKNFDKSVSLSNDIIGKLEVIVNGNDPAEGRVLFIGKGMVEQNYDPEGNVEHIETKYNKLIFNGSAFDKDDLNANIQINVYIDDFLSYSIFTKNKRFSFEEAITIPEGSTEKHKVRIEALNIGGGKNVNLFIGEGTFVHPIQNINGMRLSNGSHGLPVKLLVDVLKEDCLAGLYYIRYNDHHRENYPPENGTIKEGWATKDAFYPYSCWGGKIKSGKSRPVYVNEAMRTQDQGRTANIPKGQSIQPLEVVYANADVFVIWGNEQRNKYMIRYNSSVDNIWKDRWVSRDYFVSVPDGL